MAVDTEVVTDPKLERRTRRQFSAAEKRRLLSEYDNLPRGEKGAWLRREGLYGAQLANWRKTLKEQGEQGLDRNPEVASPRTRESGVSRTSNGRTHACRSGCTRQRSACRCKKSC